MASRHSTLLTLVTRHLTMTHDVVFVPALQPRFLYRQHVGLRWTTERVQWLPHEPATHCRRQSERHRLRISDATAKTVTKGYNLYVDTWVLGSPNVTKRCFKLSPGNQFISEIKRSKVKFTSFVFRSVQPFSQGMSTWPKNRDTQTDRPRYARRRYQYAASMQCWKVTSHVTVPPCNLCSHNNNSKWSKNYDDRPHRMSSRYWRLNYLFCCVHRSRDSQFFPFGRTPQQLPLPVGDLDPI